MSGTAPAPDRLVVPSPRRPGRGVHPSAARVGPRPPTDDGADPDREVRQRLARSLEVLQAQVLDGTLELTVVPGAGWAAVLEHDGIRAVLVIDPGAGNGYCLSPRELQIARMVAAGATNRAIADALDISLWTVSTHLRRVFAKTGVASRAEMVAELFGGLHVPFDGR